MTDDQATDPGRQMVLTLTGTYRRCGVCHHPGPPADVAAVVLAQPSGSVEHYFIPHRDGCPMPNPVYGPTVTFRMSPVAWLRDA